MTAAKGANNTGSVWLVKRKTLPDYWRGSVTLPDGSKSYVKHEQQVVCQALVDDLLTRVKRGDPIRSSAVGTVEAECRAWLERRVLAKQGKRVKLVPSSDRTYRTAIDNLICRSKGVPLNIGNVNAGVLTSNHVQQWLDALSASGMSGSYVRQGYSVLTQMFDGLVKVRAVPENPVLAVDRPERKATEGIGLEEEELDALLLIINGDRLFLRWYLALTFGVRPAEAMAIRWKDVNLNVVGIDGKRWGELTIRGQLDNKGVYLPWTKSKRSRKLKLPPDVVRRFDDHRLALAAEKADFEADGGEWDEFYQDGEHYDFCFRRPGGKKLTVSTDTVLWQNIAKDMGWTHKHRYVARHTAASHLIGNGVDALVAADMLGHRNPMITLNVYGHALDRGKSEAAAIMSGVMERSAARGHAAVLTAGETMSLEDIREQLVNLGLNTSEIDAKIDAEKDEAREYRPRRTARRV